MKTSRTTLKVAGAIAGMALFLGAAAAAGVDRGKELAGHGTLVTAPDVVTSTGQPDPR